MNRRVVAWVVSLIAAVGLAAQAGELKDWRRHPVATAPYMAQAPKIDGTVDRAEWQCAALLGPLKPVPDGVADELTREVYVGYDDQNLYVAFRLERPAGAPAPQTPDPAGHVDNWRGGDSVELILDVAHGHKTYYGFVLYANGAFGEGIGNPGMDRNWDAPWRQAATATDNGWQGEMAIPFTSLKLAGPPKAGDVWGFDVVDNRRTPSVQLAQWAFRGNNWHNFGNFGHLRFGGRDVPAARFQRAADAGDGRMIVTFEIVNGMAAACRTSADVRVLRRKAGAEGGPKSYYDNIESGGEYDRTQNEFEKSTKLDALMDEALRFYAPVDGGSVAQSVETPAGQRRGVGLLAPGTPGEYLVLYNFTASDGAPLLRGATTFRIETPLSLNVEPYWLHAQVIDVTADLRRIKRAGRAEVVFTLTDNAGAKFGEQRVEALPETERVKATLATKGLTQGFYKVQAAVIENGKEVARNAESVEKPAVPPWHNNSLGKMEVSKPWTPVRSTPEGRVEMWGRTYLLDQGLPRSIVTQGDELLAAPVRVEVIAGGKPLAWTAKTFARESVTAGKAVYRLDLDSAQATLAGTVAVEFDGFAWYELKLAPKQPGLQVDGAAIAVDLNGKHMRLIGQHKYLTDTVLYPKGAKPVKGGGPKMEESLLPFTCYLWLGDESGGLAWIGEGPIGWKLRKPNECLAVTPGVTAAEPTRLRVRFIDAPSTLDGPMRLEFGLQASPIRPFPREDLTQLAQGGGPSQDDEWYKAVAAAGGKTMVFHGGWKGTKDDWGGWPARPKSPEAAQRVKDGVALAHKYGLKVMLYTGWGVMADSAEYRNFGSEFTRRPVENSGFGTYRQAAGLDGCYADYVAWAVADLIREYGNDGVFWDSCSNLFTDENLRIGNGWVDEKGNVRPTFPVRATRDLFRRVYNLVHGEMKDDGACINFGGSVWCINAYADIFHRGEGTPMHVKTLLEAWDPLETYRADYFARPFGLNYLAMNKNFKRLPMTVNKHHAVTLLHGQHTKSAGRLDGKENSYDVQASPHGAIWRARNWLPMDDTRRSFYFFDGQKALAPADGRLLASAFVSGDSKRALLVVSNLGLEPVKGAAVRIDRAALGLAPGVMKLEDAILSKPVALDGDGFTVDVESERFRLLKLSVGE